MFIRHKDYRVIRMQKKYGKSGFNASKTCDLSNFLELMVVPLYINSVHTSPSAFQNNDLSCKWLSLKF